MDFGCGIDDAKVRDNSGRSGSTEKIWLASNPNSSLTPSETVDLDTDSGGTDLLHKVKYNVVCTQQHVYGGQ